MPHLNASQNRFESLHCAIPGMRIDSVAGPDEAAEAVAEGAVRAFEQQRLTGVRRVRTVAVAGVGSVHRRLSIVVHERHLECWVTWVNLE